MGICCSFRENGPKKPLPDLSYDFLIKRDIQKDGLDIYKPKTSINSVYQLKCPLCKCVLPEEEYFILNNKLNLANENELSELIKKFNDETKNPYKIDNIDELEIIFNQINDCTKAIEDNRYYRHICTNNELFKRTENQEIYIDLCSLPNLDNLKNNLLVDIDRLKMDENYKNNYLSNKAIIHNNYMKKERKQQIENEYRPAFEKNTSDKEQYEYETTTMFIKQVYEGELARENNNPTIPGMMQIEYKPNPSAYYYSHEAKFRYSGTKKKLYKFIENLTGQTIWDDNIYMQNWEYEEFQKFILEREPEYRELININ